MVGYTCQETLVMFMKLEKELLDAKHKVCLLAQERIRYESVNNLKNHLKAEYLYLCLQKARLEVKMKQQEIYDFMHRENWSVTPYEHFTTGS